MSLRRVSGSVLATYSANRSDPLYGAKKRSVVHGVRAMGGEGKTVLLTRLAWDPRVLGRFPSEAGADGQRTGGVVWIDVGRDVDSAWALLSQLKGALGIQVKADKADVDDQIKEVAAYLRGLDGGRLLILLDNVWSRECSLDVVHEFLALLPVGARVVLSTREAEVVEDLEGVGYDLSELTPAEALAMLREALDDQAERLADADERQRLEADAPSAAYVLANIERQRAHVAFLRDFIVKQESEFVAGDRWTLGV